MKILVTGGAGFIGSHLCEKLVLGGHDVTCYDDFSTSNGENLSFRFDLPRQGSLNIEQVDIRGKLNGEFDQVYHLACPASPVHYQKDPLKTITTAFNGTLNILEIFSKSRILITSTSEAYGDPLVHPQSESYFGNVNTVGPRSCYDEGKRGSESLAYIFSKERGVDVRVARLFNTYGPRMDLNDGRLIPNLISQILRGDRQTIHGDGGQTRSLCYVDDVVDGLIKLMNYNGKFTEFPVFNLGNPDERKVIDIAAVVAKSFGKPLNAEFTDPLEDDPKRRKPDISKAMSALGWSPSVSLEHGIELTVNWFFGNFGEV
jgi:UDP-glucuronate decarboxylase